ncbi:helix-turn-helix transcriptional regulator [Phytomonospora endophytica]|uniref:Putative DNA-binding transcriptional regulator YafY n=1 Tax=Phytomonospora endophytica TaxID=714109 RepID=A0A841FWV5_9ACTN|nr:WYL domain-containing protein [Phytomonospora endophytica]MBB6039233.1 putative DNA-binding transcriptional regulator YafY [Phytomonospora endophytica]GIG67530.1 transcriptional regulator [Phytomonospora endophytica]
MKAGRLVALLLTLQTERGATAARLAEALDVSVRTIYRDVTALQGAGVPLWTEPGPTGGIRLLDGWRTRLDGLTADEAASLFAGTAPAVLDGLGLGTVAVAAQAKVLATLPPELRDRAGRLRERFHLDAPTWFAGPDEVPHLHAVADAVWEQRRLDVGYRRGEEVARRVLDPLGLVLKAGVWYAAMRADGGRVLTYRVSRITDVAATGEVFERPGDFDLADWWAASQAAFDAAMQPLSVRVRLSPRGAARLAHAVGTLTARRALDGGGPPDDEGWTEARIDLESVHIAVSQLTFLGAEVEVLEPVEVRGGLAAVGAAMAARNG